MFGQRFNLNDVSIWITSDLHFGHANMLKFNPRSRPFRDVDHMRDSLIRQWNELVGEDDYIIHLGDFSFKGKEYTEAILSQLKGKKIMLYGNHDKTLRNQISVGQFGIIWMGDYLELNINGEKVCLMHYPIASWNRVGHGSIMLYGHEHGSYQQAGRCVDVGYDQWDRIINIKEAIDYCMKQDVAKRGNH